MHLLHKYLLTCVSLLVLPDAVDLNRVTISLNSAGTAETTKLSSSSRDKLIRSHASHRHRSQPEAMDYVVLAEKADCVTKSVINSLFQYADPRRVLVISPARTCTDAYFASSQKIQCVDENTVLPGITKASTQDWLQAKFGEKIDDMRFGAGGHTMAGWYLQQFLKMGVAEADSLRISDNYVLWDSDMVLLRKFPAFDDQGRANLMEGDTGPNNKCNQGYQRSFQKLTGLPYAYSIDQHNGFTTHHMVVDKAAMKDMLTTMSNGHHWSTAILDASCPDMETCSCGFSEYGSYASWMKSHSPDKIAEVPLQYERSSQVADPAVSCCPEHYPEYFRKKTDEGLLFVSFERSCMKGKTYVGTNELPR